MGHAFANIQVQFSKVLEVSSLSIELLQIYSSADTARPLTNDRRNTYVY
jgi:hypothetical protein